MQSPPIREIIERIWERLYPYLGAAVTGYLAWHMKQVDIVKYSQALAAPVLSIVAIIVGFTGAALTILLTATVEKISLLKTIPGAFNLLIDYHWEAILLGMASCITSLAVLVVYDKSGPSNYTLPFAMWGASTIASFLATFRMAYLLRLLLRVTESHTDSEKS